MAKKRTVRKTVKKRTRTSANRKNVAGARSAPKRSTKARRAKKRSTRMTPEKALEAILKDGGRD